MSRLAPSPGVMQHVAPRSPRIVEPRELSSRHNPANTSRMRFESSARSTASSFRASRRIHSARSTLDEVRVATMCVYGVSLSGPSPPLQGRLAVNVSSACAVSAAVAAATAGPALAAAAERMDSCSQRFHYARRHCTSPVPFQLPAPRRLVLDAPGYEVCCRPQPPRCLQRATPTP